MLFLKRLKPGTSKSAVPPVDLRYRVARKRMIESELRARGIVDERVIAAMEKLPRHLFVEEALASQAYQSFPLNIGFGQTLSQPYTVALLAQVLELKGSEKILEIGTGSGYQTAVLAGLAQKIYSIERVKPLLFKARSLLKSLEIRNVVLKYGDGSIGWQEQAPFDAIVAAAVSPEVPAPLLEQLALGGRLLVPIERNSKQHLICIVREANRFREFWVEECRFVKMVGHHAYPLVTKSDRVNSI